MFSGLSLKARASLACAYSGVAWGLFWIPLRGMDSAGVTDAWATVLFYGLPLILFSPWILVNWRRIARCGWSLHFIGIATGISLAFYSNALLYTEVVRGLVLYYTTPVWSLLLARIVLGETITPARVLAILFGLAGMLGLLVPFANLLLGPALVAGGTLLVLSLEPEPSPGADAPGETAVSESGSDSGSSDPATG